MSSRQPTLPRFKIGQLVYLTAPLDTSAMSTWVYEGEMKHPDDSARQCSCTKALSSDVIGARAGAEGITRIGSGEVASLQANSQNPAQVEEGAHAQVDETAHQKPSTLVSVPTECPLSMILTENIVPPISHQGLTSTIRHCTAWKVVEVIPATNHREENKYCLVPAEQVTAYVAESIMMEACVFVGAVVRKRNQKHGCWIVAGLSIRNGEAWADIVNIENECQIVPAKDLCMLPPNRALRAMKE